MGVILLADIFRGPDYLLELPKCIHAKALASIVPLREFQEFFQMLKSQLRKTTWRGESDGEWTILRTLVT
jgi:hypothetical protein